MVWTMPLPSHFLRGKTNMFPHPPRTKYIIPSLALTLMPLIPFPHSSRKVCSHYHPTPQLIRHDPFWSCTQNSHQSWTYNINCVSYQSVVHFSSTLPKKDPTNCRTSQNLQVFPRYDRKNHYRYRGFSGISVPMPWLNHTFYSISRKYPRKYRGKISMQVSTSQPKLVFILPIPEGWKGESS